MAKTSKPVPELLRLLTPARGVELESLVRNIVGDDLPGIAPDGAAPRFLQAAEARAARHGMSVDDLLDEYSARLRTSSYPTPDCLTPDDVQQVSEGIALSSEQQAHVASCAQCRTLLAASRLPAERAAAMAETARQTSPAIDGLVGTSEAVHALEQRVAKVSPTDANVLIVGEAGTGRSVVARAIHRLSTRKDCPFVVVHSAVLREPAEVATAKLSILLREPAANEGTLFVDEVAEMPLSAQAALAAIPPHAVRLIASTSRNLQQAVSAGTFREDLYFRLSVVDVRVPPLRERLADLPALVWLFIERHQAALGKQIAHVPSDVIGALSKHAWPGNARELENVVERALVLSAGDTLTVADLPAHLTSASGTNVDLAEAERQTILDALQRARDKSQGADSAAGKLGMTPQMLRWRMSRLGINTTAPTKEQS